MATGIRRTLIVTERLAVVAVVEGARRPIDEVAEVNLEEDFPIESRSLSFWCIWIVVIKSVEFFACG